MVGSTLVTNSTRTRRGSSGTATGGAHFIRRSGENISSAEVETVVSGHPDVIESAAYGLPSPLGEDDVAVAIVARPGARVAADAIIEFCGERRARFQVPR